MSIADWRFNELSIADWRFNELSIADWRLGNWRAGDWRLAGVARHERRGPPPPPGAAPRRSAAPALSTGWMRPGGFGWRRAGTGGGAGANRRSIVIWLNRPLYSASVSVSTPLRSDGTARGAGIRANCANSSTSALS